MLHYATFRSQRIYTFDNCFVHISDRKASRQGDVDTILALDSQSMVSTMDEQYMANVADLRKRNLLTLQCNDNDNEIDLFRHQ